MHRSFTDRVLGGVCGGLAASFPVNAWIIRLVFIILAIGSLGAGAVVYVALWWALPQESLIEDKRGSFARSIVALVVTGLILGVWFGETFDYIDLASGHSLLWPVAAVTLSVIYLLRQLTGAR